MLQVPDADIDPVQELPKLEDLKKEAEGTDIKVPPPLPAATHAAMTVCGATPPPLLSGSNRHPPVLASPARCMLVTNKQKHNSKLLPGTPDAQTLLKQTAVLKLNGGLGTSMGLEKAKSLLEVRRQAGATTGRQAGSSRRLSAACRKRAAPGSQSCGLGAAGWLQRLGHAGTAAAGLPAACADAACCAHPARCAGQKRQDLPGPDCRADQAHPAEVRCVALPPGP
jgi:hypothetical protein